ncbi:MAG: hypothetical protein AABX70_03250 [Nanoarchaeota archaeon]
MGETFHYVLTDRITDNYRAYMKHATSSEGRALLGLGPGNIDRLLFIVPPSGRFYLLVPSEERNRFSTKVGPAPFEAVKIGDGQEASGQLREDLYIHGGPFSEDPRAIVHVSHEAAFIEVAEALGLQPIKSSEEKF